MKTHHTTTKKTITLFATCLLLCAGTAMAEINIIPEIDMPGHNGAACYCYKWLSCTQNGKEPLCLGRNSTIEFAEKVYDEVFQLFPYEYVSIGGDEVNRRRWSEGSECKKRLDAMGILYRPLQTKRP